MSAFKRALAAVARTPAEGSEELAAFWPRRGQRFDGGVMVIGRAVNGWDPKWTRSEATTQSGLDRIIRECRREAEPEGRCPQEWVTEFQGERRNPDGSRRYNTRRSAFWRTVRRITHEQGFAGADWPSCLVWSNLYKFSPFASGNPDERLKTAQFESVAELLRREIEEFRPKRVVVLAGRSWFHPFEGFLGLDVRSGEGMVEATARQPDRLWVIGPHPQGKQEARLSADVARVLAGS